MLKTIISCVLQVCVTCKEKWKKALFAKKYCQLIGMSDNYLFAVQKVSLKI